MLLSDALRNSSRYPVDQLMRSSRFLSHPVKNPSFRWFHELQDRTTKASKLATERSAFMRERKSMMSPEKLVFISAHQPVAFQREEIFRQPHSAWKVSSHGAPHLRKPGSMGMPCHTRFPPAVIQPRALATGSAEFLGESSISRGSSTIYSSHLSWMPHRGEEDCSELGSRSSPSIHRLPRSANRAYPCLSPLRQGA